MYELIIDKPYELTIDKQYELTIDKAYELSIEKPYFLIPLWQIKNKMTNMTNKTYIKRNFFETTLKQQNHILKYLQRGFFFWKIRIFRFFLHCTYFFIAV